MKNGYCPLDSARRRGRDLRFPLVLPSLILLAGRNTAAGLDTTFYFHLPS